MDEIVLQRTFPQPLGETGFYALARETMDCLDLYRAQWQESFLAEQGNRLVCRFQAPDTESLRQLSRDDGARQKSVWAATVHEAGVDELARVIVERSFDEPVAIEDLQAREDAAAGCLQLHRVRFIRSLFSRDRQSMVCLYAAPDAESVRLAQQQAKMPFQSIWACRHYTPENFFSSPDGSDSTPAP
ncbi:DUF4242 domain-containing protein [Seongchinamella unica]|uniref:DUF4242 domain-containing protein n=1 Tax=Seongchinamella unica TaxID=2547392 RepID=A0A4R5LVG4_9GAMM|nr:DUF4242 domain-containing protein [Seongchinamella unica]TDG15392.1 DUF4242 domain-containing protein [Seongchinamella unica]